jgi:hypothetical protein
MSRQDWRAVVSAENGRRAGRGNGAAAKRSQGYLSRTTFFGPLVPVWLAAAVGSCEHYAKPRHARGGRSRASRRPIWVHESLGGEYPQGAIADAVANYIEDGRDHNLHPESIKRLRDAVERLKRLASRSAMP